MSDTLTTDQLVAEAEEKVKALEAKLSDIRTEWESALSREASTFAELKERREQVKALERDLANIRTVGALNFGTYVSDIEKRDERIASLEADRDRLAAEVERLIRCTIEWDEQQRNLCRFEFNRAEQAEAEVTRLKAELAALKARCHDRIGCGLEAQR